jgi:hypothetical protein
LDTTLIGVPAATSSEAWVWRRPPGDRLGVVAVTAGWMPSGRSRPVSGQDRRSDNVEAILALNDVGHARHCDEFDANPKIGTIHAS